jgi:hypothetical protein
MQGFQFFLILLRFPGNFYIEWSHTRCEYIIYIREVLAISAHGFSTMEDAWGEQGVERMICVSQSDHGFHNYINRIACNPGFYIACNNTGLRHPCSYETPARRDRVMDQLFQASSFNFLDLVEVEDSQTIILKDLQNNPLARIYTGEIRQLKYSACDWLIIFFESVYQENNYVKKKGKFSLNYRFTLKNEKLERYYTLAEPASNTTSLKNWKQELQKIACYFPVRRIPDSCNSGEAFKFTVEIKLPGFDPCCRDTLSDDPCSSPCKEPDCTPSCFLSWKTDCCFDDCCQALDFYISSLILLRRFENYRPVFDCPCGSYRIELHPQLTLKDKSDYFIKIREAAGLNTICNADNANAANTGNIHRTIRNPNFCLSEIVAINPQFYTSEQMACNAVDRSRQLINSDGLHLVEHILLRPRCDDGKGNYEECSCDGLPRPCIDKSIECHFPWKAGGDPDPCESATSICFTPGCDPYSFIATLVMPAWPERFRSASGRKIMEKLLQREAPAHILLRILWLRPRDFCCLEFYSKLWSEWLAQKLCDPANIYCDFLNLLFRKQFDPLPECTDCLPCECGKTPADSCSPDLPDPCAGKDVLHNLNELYCWSNDPQYENLFCETGVMPVIEKKRIAKLIKSLPEVHSVTNPETKTAIAKTVDLKAEEVSRKKSESAIKEMKGLGHAMPEKTGNQLMREKSRLIQSRMHVYETNIQSVQQSLPEKEVLTNALIFLKKSKPGPDQYISLTGSILKDKTDKSKNIQGMTKSQKQLVVENITWKYLDSVCFNGKDMENILALKETFRQLEKRGINMKELYKGWNSDQIDVLEPEIDFKKIKKTLVG